ncbi:MAG: Hint domain-containing protein, partial [Candidatus Hydrogenedentes bacterium]|nr:Hint domain-containing protein [Candidatus Hydrogenedentota bacterium]
MSYLKKIEELNRNPTSFPGGIVEGANVRTPCGPRRVELVRAGDLIVTRDNGLQPVRAIWRRE